MDKVKKVYSRYTHNGRESNSCFKFKLKEPLGLPDHAVCYVVTHLLSSGFSN